MPPKVKITKEAIVDAAVDLVREYGPDGINARGIASALRCSTQPVFSNFATIEDLRFAVVERADAISREAMRREIESGMFPPYKASGMSYIRFATEEKELFKLLYMRDRSKESVCEDAGMAAEMVAVVERNTGLQGDGARLFHLEMWACVHGIATMFATGFLDLDWELVSKILTDCYQGLRKRYETEEA